MSEEILKAIQSLRQEKKRNFNQSVDLIINLKNFDIKKQSLNIIANIKHKIKDNKICAFLEKNSNLVDTITKEDFSKFKTKKDFKKLVKHYDFFIAEAKLMPQIASVFGRYLGPSGKMPSPQLGILPIVSDSAIKELIEKINTSVKIKAKEPSIKVCIAKQNMSDQDIAENIESVLNSVISALPKKEENIKSVMIKFTMSKPIKIILK